jgi:hypothetical protein
MKKIKTLIFHKSVIKKACAALVADGYDRNQAIGALLEFFIADKRNPKGFTALMKAYLEILNSMEKPPKSMTSKMLLTDINRWHSPLKAPVRDRKKIHLYKTIRGPGRWLVSGVEPSPGKAVRV